MIFKNEFDGMTLEVSDDVVTHKGAYWSIQHGEDSTNTTELWKMFGWDEYVPRILPQRNGYILFDSTEGDEGALGYWRTEDQEVFVLDGYSIRHVPEEHLIGWAYARISSNTYVTVAE